MNAQARTYIYLVGLAALPILVSYGLLTEDRAPLFAALLAAVLAAGPSALALRNVTPDAPADPEEGMADDA